jgi:hypothetical protein
MFCLLHRHRGELSHFTAHCSQSNGRRSSNSLTAVNAADTVLIDIHIVVICIVTSFSHLSGGAVADRVAALSGPRANAGNCSAKQAISWHAVGYWSCKK